MDTKVKVEPSVEPDVKAEAAAGVKVEESPWVKVKQEDSCLTTAKKRKREPAASQLPPPVGTRVKARHLASSLGPANTQFYPGVVEAVRLCPAQHIGQELLLNLMHGAFP